VVHIESQFRLIDCDLIMCIKLMGLLNMQGRHFKFHCVNRVYDADNHTFWSDQLYGAEV